MAQRTLEDIKRFLREQEPDRPEQEIEQLAQAMHKLDSHAERNCLRNNLKKPGEAA